MKEPRITTVVAGDASATVAEAAKKPKTRNAPNWETEARDRLKTAIRRYSNPLADLARTGTWVQISLDPRRRVGMVSSVGSSVPVIYEANVWPSVWLL